MSAMQTDCFPDCTAWAKEPISRLATLNPRYSLEKGVEYPFVEMTAVRVGFGGIVEYALRRLEGSGLTRFQERDTLFAKITPCPESGKIAFVGELPSDFGLGSTEFIVLSPREHCHPRFLYHLMCSHDVRGRAVGRMEGSTGRQRVPEDAFQTHLRVPVPSTDEQAAIARVLDAVDNAIERTREAVLKSEGLRSSLVVTLLRSGTRGEKTRKTAAGLIPESWSAERLGEHTAEGPDNGIYRPESDYGSHGTPIVRIDSFYYGTITDLNTMRRVVVADPIRARFGLVERDLLINRVNSMSHIGKAALVPALSEVTLFESNMMRFRVGESLMPEFAILVLCSDIAKRHWLSRAKPAVNQASINQRDVRALVLPIPSMPEQEVIVSVVRAATEHVTRLRAVEQAQRVLKKSLLHDLLTGKVRVPV